MNEKIRELAEQVNVDIIEPEYAKIGGVSEVSFETYQDLEKFAELIIKETLEIVRDEVYVKKQMALSEDVIWDNMPENPMECSALAFIRGVKFAEKAHGIGEQK